MTKRFDRASWNIVRLAAAALLLAACAGTAAVRDGRDRPARQTAALTVDDLDRVQAFYWARQTISTSPLVKNAGFVLPGGTATNVSTAGAGDGQMAEFKAPQPPLISELVVRLSDVPVLLTNVLARVNTPYGQFCGGLGCFLMHVRYSLDGQNWAPFGSEFLSVLDYIAVADGDAYWVGLRAGNIAPVAAKYLKLSLQSNGAIPGGPSSLVDVVGGTYTPSDEQVQDSPPDSCAQAAWTAFTGNPINTRTGSESESATDMLVNNAGPELALSRTYNSDAVGEAPTVFGPGWSTRELAMRLDLNPESAAAASGEPIQAQAGPYTSLRLIGAPLALARYRPRYVTSGNACGFIPPRGSRAQLSCVDSNGDGTPEYWEWVIACSGLRYRFDPSGKLTSKRDLEGHEVRYEYNAQGRVSRLVAGTRFIQVTYDGAGRITSATDSAGRSVTYSYDPTSGMLNAVTDVRGNTVRYSYDSNRRLVSVTNALGESTTNTYDANGRVVVQRTGVTATNSAGLSVRQVAYPDTTGDGTTRVTDGAGRITRYRYDAKGMLVQAIDGLGNATTYAYDERRNVRSVTDPLGRVTRYSWTPCGQQTQVIKQIGGRNVVWSNSFNGYGQLTASVDPLGRRTEYLFDDASKPWRVTRVRRPDGLVTPAAQYTADGNPSRVTDLAGGVTQYRYDAQGQLTEIELPLLNGQRSVRRFTYDAMGFVRQEIDPLNAVIAETAHDNAGLVTRAQGPTGLAVTLAYDAAGRITDQIDPTQGTTHFEYDSAGRLIAVTNALGGVTRYTYDGGDQIAQMTDPTGVVAQVRYDAAGRQVALVLPAAGGVPERITTYGYNAAGELTSLNQPASGTTTMQYDALGRRIALTNALGQSARYEYNDAGEMTSVIDAKQARTGFAYDLLGRLAQVQDAAGGVTTYAYTSLGQIASITDPEGRVRRFAYDAHGNATAFYEGASSTQPLWTRQYNVADRLTSHTDGDGRQVSYTYDALGRLTRMDAPGTAEDVSYTYNAQGLVALMVDGSGRTAYSYDALGRLAQVDSQYPQLLSVRYGYDGAGRRSSLTYPNGGAVRYAYDAQGRLSSVDASALNAQLSAAYTYDARGLLAQAASAGGAWKTHYAYDAVGRRVSETARFGAAGTEYASQAYNYDAAGNLLSESVRFAGEPERRFNYAYDALNRLTARDTLQGAARIDYEQFTYDKAGNRTALTSLRSAESYAYDAANRLTTWVQKPLDQGPVAVTKTRRLRYDRSGNLLSDGERSFRYGATHRLIEQTVNGTYPDFVDDTRTYRYDGTGLLQSESATSDAYSSVWDVGTATPRRLTLGTTQLHYGPDGVMGSLRGTAPRLAVTDFRGSVLREVDGRVPPGASPLAKHTYAAYGAALSSEAQPFIGFSGELQDQHGLVYLRARHYDTRTGRFLTHDPFGGVARNPQTLNPYAYTANNPGTLTDPSGQIAPWLLGGLIGGTLGFVAGMVDCETWGCVGASTASGFVGGALGGLIAGAGGGWVGGLVGKTLGGLVMSMLSGSVGAVGSQLATNLLTQPCSEWNSGLMEAAIAGGVLGGAIYGFAYGARALINIIPKINPPVPWPKPIKYQDSSVENFHPQYREQLAKQYATILDWLAEERSVNQIPTPSTMSKEQVYILMQDLMIATGREPTWVRTPTGLTAIRLGSPTHSAPYRSTETLLAHGHPTGAIYPSWGDVLYGIDNYQWEQTILGPVTWRTYHYGELIKQTIASFFK